LSCIQSLSLLAQQYRDHVLSILIKLFGGEEVQFNEIRRQILDVKLETTVCLDLRLRCLVAEVLGFVLRNLLHPSLIVQICQSLVKSCLTVIRSRIGPDLLSNLTSIIDFRKMVVVRNDPETDQSKSADMNREESRLMLLSALLSADTIFLRQSAISLLAEVISRSGWTSINYLIDVMDVATGILTFDFSKVFKDASAVNAIRLIRRYCDVLGIFLSTIND
jgi:hypothetical protein